MFVVDTNLLVYAVNRDSPEHRPCLRLLAEWRESPVSWYLTWKILYEFARVVTHRRVLPAPLTAPQAFGFIGQLLDSPSLEILGETERHYQVAREVAEEVALLSGNLLHDAHTAILMREHGIRQIRTRDTDFHRFPWVEVVDPLA